MALVNLFSGNQTVKIDSGELVSYQVDGHEYIHQKGSLGWRNSDTEMFPIIGPTAEADFKVSTPKGEAIQDQHGLLRELVYELIEATDKIAVFQKKYSANTKVKNSKYPAKSNEEFLQWPYDFDFKKVYELTEKGLEVSFIIVGENGMPFMLGYHPAFNLATKNPSVIANEKEISLAEVLKVGSRALQVGNCNEIILKDKNSLKISTEGFGNFMLWTEVDNMICIEPITFYPYAVAQENLSEGFSHLGDKLAVFKMQISIAK
tara:strand:- start:69036 stop:69821 length:786 start_codon:yes stop_codon:yes gene_type:complete